MTDELISAEDFDIVDRAYSINNLEGRMTDVLALYENLGYEITKELVEEVILVDDYNLIEQDSIQIRFYVKEEEKKKHFGKFLKDKVTEIGDEYTLIALSYQLKDNKVEQKNEGLVLKRVTIPRYIARIVQATGLINCTSENEIEEFNFMRGKRDV